MVGLVITAVVMGGLLALSPGDEFSTVRRMLGLGADRYGSPPAYTPGEGTFEFLLTKPGGEEPVAYDPCRPVEYVVNPDGAPEGWEPVLADAVEHVEWATGLLIRDAGRTDERPFDPAQRGPFAGQERPVVIGFADADELDGLEGDIAGLGGSLAVRDAFGAEYYATGSVALDTDVFTTDGLERNREFLTAVIEHELGHVLGLDHVEDPGELMHERPIRTSFGPGDLEGLARLGSVPCR